MNQFTSSPRHKARLLKAKLFGFLCFFSALLGVFLLGFLLFGVAKDGLRYIDWDFLNSFPSRLPQRAGIKAAIAGSLWVIGLTAVISIPIGIAAAIYLEEFAQKNKLNSFIQLNIANLAGVPSIVYGLLGLAVFVRMFSLERSVLSGALTMSLLILPTIIIVAQESLKAVPKSLREGSLALGATRWQTLAKQIIPNAMPGILTGVILSISRAIGETAPLIAIGALTYVAFVPNGPMDGFTALPIQIFNWTSRPQEEFHDLASAGIIVLLIVLLVMNGVAIYLRNRLAKKLS